MVTSSQQFYTAFGTLLASCLLMSDYIINCLIPTVAQESVSVFRYNTARYMLSMQTKIETPKRLLALPFPFYVSGVFGSICGGELMGRFRSHNRGRRPQARGPRKTIEKDKCAIFSENYATLNVINSRGYTHICVELGDSLQARLRLDSKTRHMLSTKALINPSK